MASNILTNALMMREHIHTRTGAPSITAGVASQNGKILLEQLNRDLDSSSRVVERIIKHKTRCAKIRKVNKKR